MPENYLEDLKKFDMLCKAATKLSIDTHGRKVDSWREEYGSRIFGKIVATAIAILKLLPESQLFNLIGNFKIWDISSISVLARSLLETYNIFYYLIIQEIENDELEFRFIVWNLHSQVERLKMLDLIKSKHPEIEMIKNDIQKWKYKLENNSFYQALTNDQKKDFRKGKKGIFLTNTQISEKAGIDPDYYKSTYKSLSSYVHTFPFSISQIAFFKFGDPDSLSLLNTVLQDTTGYLSLSVRDFVKMVPDQKSCLSSDIFEIIDTCSPFG